MKRVYISSVSFCTALFDHQKSGLLAENAVLSLTPFQFFWRDNYNHEVDFIEVKNKSVLPVEVKYKSNIRNDDFSNLAVFCHKFQTNEAILLSGSFEIGTTEYKGIKVQVKPLFIYLAEIQ